VSYDLNDVLRDHGTAGVRRIFDTARPYRAVDVKAEALNEATDGIKFRLIPLSEIHPIVTAPWLIKHILPSQGLAVVYGAPSAGKSALLLDAMLHVASGRPWAGRKTLQGGVIYIAAESGIGVQNRVWAMKRQLDIRDETFALIRCKPNLGTADGDAAKLIEDIQAQAPKLAQKPVAIVIDTLARSMGRADENSTRDMNQFVDNAEEIARAFGCLCIVVHHSGKDESKGGRGSNALLGAVETEWEITNGEDGRKARTTKVKDGFDDWEWSFKIEPITIGKDEDGEDVTAATVEVTADAVRKARESKSESKKRSGASPEERALLDILKNAMLDAGGPPKGDANVPNGVKALSREMLRKYAETMGWLNDRSNPRQLLNSALNRLSGKGLIGRTREYVWLA
jgi:hypothetical protein